MSLKRFLNSAYNLSYKENSFVNKKHEEYVRFIIEGSGFMENKRYNNLSTISRSQYIYQPYGSQNPPDFSINYQGKLYNIECKTSKRVKTPMWNCSIPDSNTIYIFSIPTTNILFFGDWIINEKTRELMNSFVDESKSISKKYNDRLLELDFEYKWNVAFRKMFIQKTTFDLKRQNELRERMEDFIQRLEED